MHKLKRWGESSTAFQSVYVGFVKWTVGSVLKSAARPEAESALDGSSQDHQGQPPDTRVFRLFTKQVS